MAAGQDGRQAVEGNGRGEAFDHQRFATIFRALVLAFLAGWVLVLGRDLLVPIVAAIISVYVLTSAADALSRIPALGRLPIMLLRILVLILFTLIVVFLVLVVIVTIEELIAAGPAYRTNLEALIARVADFLGLESHPTWDELRRETLGRIDVQAMLGGVFGSLTSLGGAMFLVIVYAGFLMSERGTFPAKLAAAFPQGDRAELTVSLFADIDRRISEYLAVKTLINIILGALSYAVLWAMGIDFALFWAMLIGLLNYIPYVGSLIAVALPVIVSLAQFGSVETTLFLLALLIAVQGLVSNIMEPRMIGRQLNLSPFVVLMALSFWSALWGLAGAILAIPMTSMLAIIFAAFPATRFIAVLLAQRIEPAEAAK